MNIHLFNPENDLALANGGINFTPPKSAIDLARAGAALPMWYGEPGDFFLGAVNGAWFEKISNDFGLDVKPYSSAYACSELQSCNILPWGWSAVTRKNLLDMGFPTDVLPTIDNIDAWRNLSSRVTSADIISKIITDFDDLGIKDQESSLPFTAVSLSDALSHIARIGTAMIKLPWSGSGRGQQVSDRTTPLELERRLSGMIKRQGGVEITPYYHKKLDFAMLWENGRFVGYSLFETDTHGGWTHNILMPDTAIEDRINATLQRPFDFDNLKMHLTRLLNTTAAEYGYHGPVGFDFIVAEKQGITFVVPIEINWRRTMGHVAHRLANRFVAPGRRGQFLITPRTAELPNSQYTVSENRLDSGTLDLTPPVSAFRFLLTISPST